MKKKYLPLLVSIGLLNTGIFAQSPKYSNNFLSLGVGAKALGLGNAVVASVGDVSSAYWNPAGIIGKIDNRQIGLMHSEYFGGVASYDYASLVVRNDHRSAYGISLIRFGVDNIPNTLTLIDPSGKINYNNVGAFSAADYAGILSYGRQTKDQTLKIGFNIKIIRRVVGSFASSWGFGMDFGVQKIINKKWQIGLVARDFSNTYNIWRYNKAEFEDVFSQTGNLIPQNAIELTKPRVVVGLGRLHNINPKLAIRWELNADITTDGKRNTIYANKNISIDPLMGIELGYKQVFFVRTGINNIQYQTNSLNQRIRTVQPNIGAGFKYNRFNIDYAMTNFNQTNSGFASNVFSVLIDFGKIQK